MDALSVDQKVTLSRFHSSVLGTRWASRIRSLAQCAMLYRLKLHKRTDGVYSIGPLSVM
jgi:hypothetical protein